MTNDKDINLENALVMYGDAIQRLKELPDNSVDSIVTDPPYGLSDNKFVAETIAKWINGERAFIPDGKGFMGKQWDAFVPPPAIWDECLRVLKPGGHLLAFFGTRTQDIGALSIRLAGFEIRDSISWVYGSGFPKSLNIGKSIEAQIKTGSSNKTAFKHLDGEKSTVALGYNKNNNNGDFRPNDYNGRETTINHTLHTAEAKQWEGWGTALKPAHEPILVARKPISESTIANNVLQWGTGGLNIDASRIGFTSEADYKESTQKNQHADFGTAPMEGNNTYGDWSMIQPKNYKPTGRFPANFILSHSEDCVETGDVITDAFGGGAKGSSGFAANYDGEGWQGSVASTPVFKCADGCPVAELDKQSGTLSPGHWAKVKTTGFGEFGNGSSEYEGVGEIAKDKGGASRFFYVAKASKKDRNEGLDGITGKEIGVKGNGLARTCEKCGASILNPCECPDRTYVNPVRQNFHPTVKPTQLMEYLVRLVTPEGGTVLDPFTGSGSTGKAALLNGFKFIGCELTEDYLPIIEGRLRFAEVARHKPSSANAGKTVRKKKVKENNDILPLFEEE